MVKAKHMTAEQAKAHLIQIQESVAERQREYVQRKKEEGRKRINTFISGQAAEVLEHWQNYTGKTIGDVLSDALIAYGNPNTTIHRSVITHVSSNKPKASAPEVDGQIEQRITELAKEGLGSTKIAARLSKEGFRTVKGNTIWNRDVVRRIMKRLDV